MATHKKRRVDEEMKMLESNSDDEQSDSGEMDDQPENAVDDVTDVHIDFEARTAEESDFHGIQKLLKQLFLKAHLNTGELTDTIISQNYVGSVLKQIEDDEAMDEDEDEEDMGTVYGIVTAVNITHRKTLNCVKELQTYILGKCTSPEVRDKLQSLLSDDSQHVGLLINERFINIPPPIAVPTLNCLWEELTEANTKKMKYKFSYYLMVSKTYFMGAPTAGKKGKKNKKQSSQGQRMFSNPEEELFHQESVLSFDFSVKKERDTAIGGDWQGEDDELEPFRTVMVVPASKIPAIMGRMSELYASPLQS